MVQSRHQNEELRDRIHTLEMNKKGLKTQIETLKKQEPKEKIVEMTANE